MIVCFARLRFLGAIAQDEGLAHESAIAEPACKYATCCPDDGDHNCDGMAYGPILRRCRPRPMFRHNLRWNQFDDDQNAQWHDDNVVHVAYDGHEVRNQINGRECIASNANSQRLGIPRHARVARRAIDRVHVSFDEKCPMSRSLTQRAMVSHASNTSTTSLIAPRPFVTRPAMRADVG